jgi:hypothetical protein
MPCRYCKSHLFHLASLSAWKVLDLLEGFRYCAVSIDVGTWFRRELRQTVEKVCQGEVQPRVRRREFKAAEGARQQRDFLALRTRGTCEGSSIERYPRCRKWWVCEVESVGEVAAGSKAKVRSPHASMVCVCNSIPVYTFALERRILLVRQSTVVL